MADQAQIEHLLRRTEYVARPQRVLALKDLTLDAAIDDILDVTTPVALPAYIDHSIDGEGWDQYVFATQWWMDLMAFDSPKPIQEKMTWFWHGHFTSAWSKVNDTWQMTKQNKLYRDNALGDFYVLTKKMAVEEAMLVYLDNADNTKASPNENFARELLELFTLGIGNYLESDVEAAARAWTGHTIEWDETLPNYLQYTFKLSRHDTKLKTFCGKTQNFDGPDIIDELLQNNASKKQIAARFIVGKLWEFFAHPGPPTAVLDALAPAFAADWNIKSLLKSMFLRPEFFAPAALEPQVRSPVEWIVAVMYCTNRRAAELHPEWYLEGMGQVPFNPPNVAGWKANGYWVNTSTIGERGDFAKDVANRLRAAPDPYAYIAAKSGKVYTTTVDVAVDTIANLFAIAPLTAQTRNAIIGYLNAERAPGGNNWWQVTNLLTMGLLAPEMHVA